MLHRGDDTSVPLARSFQGHGFRGAVCASWLQFVMSCLVGLLPSCGLLLLCNYLCFSGHQVQHLLTQKNSTMPRALRFIASRHSA